ncbi:MAG: dicarboxylate/amino acid:cation symporter, partial [Opitutales bacterium]|nr:dicarboxylate/amino acid:cation symporter [Opitutales bacterium]
MELHKIKLTRWIVMAMLAGAVVGLTLSQFVEFAIDSGTGRVKLDAQNRPILEQGFVADYIINGFFQFLSEAIIRSLKALVIPLVFVSLICGTAAMDDVRKLGTIGLKTLALYLFTTAVAITIAIIVALIVRPGEWVQVTDTNDFVPGETKPLLQVFIDIFPENVVFAFVNGEMLQIIVAALSFGIALVVAGDHGRRILDIFKDLNEVIMKLVII